MNGTYLTLMYTSRNTVLYCAIHGQTSLLTYVDRSALMGLTFQFRHSAENVNDLYNIMLYWKCAISLRR